MRQGGDDRAVPRHSSESWNLLAFAATEQSKRDSSFRWNDEICRRLPQTIYSVVMGRMVALLRAVNVGGRKVPMAELRALCGQLGWADVATYIQSGHVVFSAPGKPEALVAELEAALEKAFGIEVPVMVRTRAEWAKLAAANPFPEAARDEPNRLMLLVTKAPPAAGAAAAIEERAKAGERVRAAGGALWFHYPQGAGTSKLTPSLIDRAAGAPGTARNHRTVMKLLEMLDA
jgi:uncharacterized protein (DUF1697 family)